MNHDGRVAFTIYGGKMFILEKTLFLPNKIHMNNILNNFFFFTFQFSFQFKILKYIFLALIYIYSYLFIN